MDWDDQSCDIDNAPIRKYFDQVDTRAGRRGSFSVMSRIRNMLIGDELTFRDDEHVAIRDAITALQRDQDKTFSTKTITGTIHVWRDA